MFSRLERVLRPWARFVRCHTPDGCLRVREDGDLRGGRGGGGGGGGVDDLIEEARMVNQCALIHFKVWFTFCATMLACPTLSSGCFYLVAAADGSGGAAGGGPYPVMCRSHQVRLCFNGCHEWWQGRSVTLGLDRNRSAARI